MQLNRAESQLKTLAHEAERWADGLFALAERAPARLTVRQALAFALIVDAHVMGRSVTMKDLREATDGVVGQSIEKTIQLFFSASRDYPDALAWVDQVPDPNDRRRKYLKLTPAGVDAAHAILQSLRPSNPADSD